MVRHQSVSFRSSDRRGSDDGRPSMGRETTNESGATSVPLTKASNNTTGSIYDRGERISTALGHMGIVSVLLFSSAVSVFCTIIGEMRDELDTDTNVVVALLMLLTTAAITANTTLIYAYHSYYSMRISDDDLLADDALRQSFSFMRKVGRSGTSLAFGLFLAALSVLSASWLSTPVIIAAACVTAPGAIGGGILTLHFRHVTEDARLQRKEREKGLAELSPNVRRWREKQARLEKRTSMMAKIVACCRATKKQATKVEEEPAEAFNELPTVDVGEATSPTRRNMAEHDRSLRSTSQSSSTPTYRSSQADELGPIGEGAPHHAESPSPSPAAESGPPSIRPANPPAVSANT